MCYHQLIFGICEAVIDVLYARRNRAGPRWELVSWSLQMETGRWMMTCLAFWLAVLLANGREPCSSLGLKSGMRGWGDGDGEDRDGICFYWVLRGQKKQQKKKNSVDGVQVITTRAGISGIFQMYD